MRICLFSSYYTEPEIPFHARVYLTELRRHFDRVVLLTNDDKSVPAADQAWLSTTGIELMLVVNEGYDFGMWTKGAASLESCLDTAEELCLANDSCLLVAPLDGVLDSARARGAEVFGLTESHERGYTHLQSYFLLFRGVGVAMARDFLTGLGIMRGEHYNTIVDNGELGLSRAMVERGLQLNSFFTTDHKFTANPAILRAAKLIRLGHPLLKRRLLRHNSNLVTYYALRTVGLMVGYRACRRLLVAVSGMTPAMAKGLIASDKAIDDKLTLRPGVQWLRLRIRFNVRWGSGRVHVQHARHQPWPGIWRTPPA